jgi:hypothetical protein
MTTVAMMLTLLSRPGEVVLRASAPAQDREDEGAKAKADPLAKETPKSAEARGSTARAEAGKTAPDPPKSIVPQPSATLDREKP